MPAFLSARPPRNPAEEKKIRQLAGARHAPADWILRARIIAVSWAGQRTTQIATELECHPKTVRRWLHRFNLSSARACGETGTWFLVRITSG
ncbi:MULTISPECIES: helix-turn-helix domain-containing protein [unclassified Frankia]|uniref:helix-turn-helix domain-containing protein n=1 Tax=unclassified Frankia TaxID=2632575 RepID=UPI0020249996